MAHRGTSHVGVNNTSRHRYRQLCGSHGWPPYDYLILVAVREAGSQHRVQVGVVIGGVIVGRMVKGRWDGMTIASGWGR